MSTSAPFIWIAIGLYCLSLLRVSSTSDDCPSISIPALNRPMPLNKCMKLHYHSDEYTSFTCHNDTVYTQTYSDHNCKSDPLSSVQTHDYDSYNCQGNTQSCNYVKLLSFDTCTPSTNYTTLTHNHSLTYHLTDTTHTCNDYALHNCTDGHRTFVEECHNPFTSDIDCGLIYDSDTQNAIPLHTCNTIHAQNLSFEYYCDAYDNTVYKCVYNNLNCDNACTESVYTDYDLAICDANVCPRVQYNKYSNCHSSITETISQSVDVCISNDMHNVSTIWKCKQHSMAKYMYTGTGCDSHNLISESMFEFNDNKCVEYEGEYMRMEILSCASHKCRATENTYDSYEICHIFEDTNVDKVIPFWDTYSNDYCEWFAADQSFSFNIYQCNTNTGNGLTLSLATPTITGALDTMNHAWPNNLFRLNLNDLGLNGVWNWWALQSNQLEYIDISNNNFGGVLDLFPLLYSQILQTVKISNNPLMSGYIDWSIIGYMAMHRDLSAFTAIEIEWEGFADFTLIPNDKSISLALDTNYHCNPYKYICESPLVSGDRSDMACTDQYTCESTCMCSDGSTAMATHFPYTPVVGSMHCGEVIHSAYDTNARNIFGDNGHYYLVHIPYEPGKEYNITFDATDSAHFNGRIVIYAMDESIPNTVTYQQIYDMSNPLQLTVVLQTGMYYYLQIIASHSVDGMDCVNVYNDEIDYSSDKYWELYQSGFYQSGYACDYSDYAYSISMHGCTVPPSISPTPNPTVFYSTTTDTPSDIDETSVIFEMSEYENGILINDVYARTVISMQVYIKSELQMSDNCIHCFEWYLRDMNDTKSNAYMSLNKQYGYKDSDITFYNIKTGTVIMDRVVYDVFNCYIVIASIRTAHANYCPDMNKIEQHLLRASTAYELKMNVHINDNIFIESDALLLMTHTQPSNGVCTVTHDSANEDMNSTVFHRYSIDCTGWESHIENDEELRYNLLYSNVPLSDEFLSNPLSVSIGGVGHTVLTALIQDTASVITCYEVIVPLSIVNESNIYELMHEISDIIDSGEIHHKIDIVSIFSTMQAVFRVTPMNDYYMEITDKLFDYLLHTSVVLTDNNTLHSSMQDKVNEISIFKAATADSVGYIGLDALDALIYEYTPKLLQLMREYINSANHIHYKHKNSIANTAQKQNMIIDKDDSNSIDLYGMAMELHNLIQNLEAYVSEMDTDVINMHTLTNALVQSTLHTSYIALLDSYPGEIFEVYHYSLSTREEKHVIAQRFATQFDTNNTIQCGFEREFITIPSAISEYNALLDCSVLKYNGTISANIYGEDSHLPINDYQQISDCDPYLISFNVNDGRFKNENEYILYENTWFPQCKIWNSSKHKWNVESDCFVYDIDANKDIVTCACTDLSMHRVSENEFVFVPSVLPIWNWRDISSQNFYKYWVVWITIAILLVIIVFLSGLKWVDKTVNRPILAYEDVIFIKKRNDRMRNDIAGKEIYYILKYLINRNNTSFDGNCIGLGIWHLRKSISFCNLGKLHFKLFLVYLRSAHLLLSIFIRPSGSNISVRTRIALFCMYLLNIFAIMSVYYSIEFLNTRIYDIVFIPVIAILSYLPIHYLTELFVKSKPKTIPKSIYLYEDIHLKKVNAINADDLHDKSILDYLRDSHKDRVHSQSDLSETYADSLQKLRKNSINEKIATLDLAVEELRKTNSNMHRIELVDDIRITLLKTLYPLPHCCKCIAWLVLIIWTAFVSIIAILFSLQFNLRYEAQMNPKYMDTYAHKDECWLQNNKKYLIESELSYAPIHELNDNTYHSQMNTHYLKTHLFGDTILETEECEWLVSCAISIVLFLVIFQPIWICFITWVKIWMFSWNLRMKISMKNVCALLNKICCSNSERNQYSNAPNGSPNDQISASLQIHKKQRLYPINAVNAYQIAKDESRDTTTEFRRTDTDSYYHSIVNNQRYLDVFGYLCNNDLFLSIDSKTGKLRAIDDNESSILCLDACSDDSSEEKHSIVELTKSQSSNNRGRHDRQMGFTDLSVTVTENGEIFDADELAMMRIAAGNIFDYKTDVIAEGNELEIEEIEEIEEETSNIFSFDLNSDGIEESDDDITQTQDDSDTRNVFDTIDNSHTYDAFDDLDFSALKELNKCSNETSVTRSETDTEDTIVENEESNEESNEENGALINAISIAIAINEENNKELHDLPDRQSTDSAQEILNPNLKSEDSNSEINVLSVFEENGNSYDIKQNVEIIEIGDQRQDTQKFFVE